MLLTGKAALVTWEKSNTEEEKLQFFSFGANLCKVLLARVIPKG